MDSTAIKKILNDVATGRLSAEEALGSLSSIPFVDIGIAKHDSHRPLRNGFSEVILCEGKRREHVIKIVEGATSNGLNIFGTRADMGLCEEVRAHFKNAEIDHQSRTFKIVSRPIEPMNARLAVVSAGTADLQVAEEACHTAQFFGLEANRYYDVGVAGLQRLLSCIPEIKEADVIIVVAGMEGALPSVIGGLTAKPIVAVPTSVGYGANFKGVAALLGMLNSCSEGITVVNIDNGFGAACAALRIIRMAMGIRKRGE